MKEFLLIILGYFIVIFGVLDGFKYHWLASSIRKVKIAKGQSRKFVNVALGKDIVVLTYLCFHPDKYLFLMTFIGFIFTIELLITIYLLYPYRKRGLNNFKRPSFIKYFINSLIPNKHRKKL